MTKRKLIVTLSLALGMLGVVHSTSTKATGLNTFFDVTTSNGYPTVKWAVDMPPENVINETGFEDGEEVPDNYCVCTPAVESDGAEIAYAETYSNQVNVYYAEGYVTREEFETRGLSTFQTYFDTWDLPLYQGYSRYFVLTDGTTRWDYNVKSDGLQGVTSDEAYEGTKSYYRLKTADNKLGNAFNTAFQEYTYQSRAVFAPTYDLKNGMQLSLSFMLKTKGDTNIAPFVLGGQGMRTFSFTEYPWSLDRPLIVTQEAEAGQNRVYASGLDQVAGAQVMYITTNHFSSTDSNDGYFWLPVTTINADEGYIETQDPLPNTFPVGYELHFHRQAEPVTFNEEDYNTHNQWQVVNFNSPVTDFDWYDVQKLGVSLFLDSTSYDDTYFDNLKLGYATKVQILRGATLLYEGYDTEYEDTVMNDTTKPTNPTSISIKDVNGDSTLDFVGGKDPQNNVTYTMNSFNKDNTAIIDTKTKTVDVSSGIKEYRYIFSTNASLGNMNGYSTSTTGKDVFIPYTVNRNMYLYVQLVDNNGNKSSMKKFSLTTSLPMQLTLAIPQIQPISTVLDKDIKTLKTNFTDQLRLTSKYLATGDSWRLTVKADNFKNILGDSFVSRLILQGNLGIQKQYGAVTDNKNTTLVDLSSETTLLSSTQTNGLVTLTFDNDALVNILTSLDKFKEKDPYNSTITFSLISAP